MTAGECSSASLAWSRPIFNFLTDLIGKNLNDVNLGKKNIERPVEEKQQGECALRYRVAHGGHRGPPLRFLAGLGVQERVKILPRPGLRAVRPDEPKTAHRIIILYGRCVFFVL